MQVNLLIVRYKYLNYIVDILENSTTATYLTKLGDTVIIF